ncbi:dye-decolorizing heme-containing peroxidase [Lecanora helva]
MATSAPKPLDFNNVQGDILLGGLPKKTQTFLFFQIDANRIQEFRKQLTKLVPLITSTAQVIKDRTKIGQNKQAAEDPKTRSNLLVKLSGVNIAFSHTGLVQIGVKDKINDNPFDAGMQAGAKDLGDPGSTSSSGTFSPSWDPEFKKEIHGVLLITGDSHATVHEKLAEVGKIFCLGAHNATIHEIKRAVGDVRPGAEKGHEHFGFLDGISVPAVKDVDKKTNRGQETVRQGIILLGREGDTVQRPSWALDGSFLSFRYLSQLVPEFNGFLKAKAIPGLPPHQGAELLGARLVGRWKSGAPIDVTPTADDPALGLDPTRNNDFSFNSVFPDDQSTQDRCPFAAHVRKTNPRADLNKFGGTEIHRIIRSGIAFGPEVSAEEAKTGKTQHHRGLLFVAYQSNIAQGFQFIQEQWANAPTFPPQKPVQPGFDPIIGQSNDPNLFELSGVDPNNQATQTKLPTQWVVPKGGEYFFTPSITSLKDTFAVSA